MGRVVPFSHFEDYYSQLTQDNRVIDGTILDANVIITLSYSPKKYHSRLTKFLSEQLHPKEIAYFTTVNTTFEYLEFHRRLLMTEGLRDAVDEFSALQLPRKKRQSVRYHSGRLKNRENTQGTDPVFYDREIKDIRKAFCASGEKGIQLWSSLSMAFLNPKLQQEFENLETLGIKYLSIHNKKQRPFFVGALKWEDAIKICTNSCAGISDAMILNALQTTTFPFAISLDTDVIYAVLSNPNLKDIVVPDDLIADDKELRSLLI
ncbi:MAG: hypothetical protein H6624_20255 [Bdellovibrionaceae bacterium]|nr:hypothetical protein [Bdellovibrionales bacterium]MCB9086686.1 hypothetical protein [Pseudobdellovibrionaceae bacterium]